MFAIDRADAKRIVETVQKSVESARGIAIAEFVSSVLCDIQCSEEPPGQIAKAPRRKVVARRGRSSEADTNFAICMLQAPGVELLLAIGDMPGAVECLVRVERSAVVDPSPLGQFADIVKKSSDGDSRRLVDWSHEGW